MKESSTIKNIRWTIGDPDKLTIEFKHGGVYEYDGVPEHVYLDFAKADSLGKYFHKNIKDEFTFNKLENEQADK